MDKTIIVPSPKIWTPRDYQLPFLKAMDEGKKKAVLVWNRKSGKTITLINFAVWMMMEKPMVIYHVFPKYRQAKETIWESLTNDGMSYLDYFPPELIKRKNNSDLLIEFINGSIYKLIGSDNFDTLRGPNPYVVILDEYAEQFPLAYDTVFAPILLSNKGIVVFAFTPKGKNHAYKMYQKNINNPDWFVQKLTIDDTHTVSSEDIEIERREGRLEMHIQQEYYCSFEGSVDGSYYIKQISQARTDKRITKVPYESSIPVNTFWDLGYNDYMAIWFIQHIGKEIRVIDYYQNRQEAFEHYVKILKEKPYVYNEHYLPHDVAVHELSAGGKSRKEILEGLGIKPVVTVERARNREAVIAGIEAIRGLFNKLWFDEEKCAMGLSALEGYHAAFDEKKNIILDNPVHDWTSNAADAFRTFAVGYKEVVKIDNTEIYNIINSYRPSGLPF